MAEVLKNKKPAGTGEVQTESRRSHWSMEALRKSEEKYRFLYEESPAVSMVIGIDGTIKDVNKSFIEKLGYSKDEIIGKHALEFVVPEQREKVTEQLERDFKGDYTPEIDVDICAKGGSIHTILFSPGQMILYEEDQPTGILITGVDITERKRTEEALRESEAQYRSIFHSATDSFLVFDLDGNIVEANSQACKMYGYSYDELIKLSGKDIVHPDYYHLFEQFKQDVRMTGEFHGESVDIRKDGTTFNIEVRGTTFAYKGKTHLLAVIRDVTERKQVEEELRESEERYGNLFHHSNDAIFMHDLEGNIIDVNQKALNQFGYTKREISLLKISDLHPSEALRKSTWAFEKISKDGFVSFEIDFKKKNGRVFPAEVSSSLFEVGGKEVIQGIVRNITERKRAEEKLKDYTHQIEEKNLELKTKNQELTATRAQLVRKEKLRALGQMASGMAHNFNNFLTIILGRAQLLQRSAKDLEIEKGLRIIEKAALDASSTIKRIQDFTRVRKDQEFKWVNIDEVIEDVIALTKTKWKDQAEANGITIELEVQKDRCALPPVAGDVSGLREVFTDIIFNATEAMPMGGKIVIKTLSDRKSVFVSFIDSGTGMPQEVKQKIFDPFFTTKGVRNTGLGLSVAYGIIQRHQGDIQIESEPGKGTTVVVRLPVSKILEKEEPKEKESVKSPVQRESANILVIEDRKDVRELLFDVLTSANYMVRSASGGAEGLEIYKREEFDIVFTDLGMPRTSGWEVAKAIKEMDPNTTVLLLTGWGVGMDEGKLKESRIDQVVTKPIKVESLLTLVSEIMESKKRAKEPMEGFLGH